MKKSVINKIIITVTIGLVSILTLWWAFHDPTGEFTINNPGQDGRPSGELISTDVIDIGANFSTFSGTPAGIKGSWTRFRGEDFDNIVKEDVKLIDGWDESGPNILWKVELGEGHAAPAIQDGRVYLIDYDEQEKADALRCFSLADGQEIWRRWYNVHVKRNHGMSRTIPAISDSFVVTIGPRCHVMCVKADSGEFVWGLDLVKEYDTQVPLWYTGQCPLIDDSLAVLAPGGKALMIGVDLKTGDIVWESPNPNEWQMSHSSIMPMTFNGKKMYLYSATGGMVGVSADSADRGEILWQTTEWNHTVIAPSPVVLDNGYIFVTAGYAAGSMMLQLVEQNGDYEVRVIQELEPDEGLASEQQTPILYEGHLFSILPKDAGALRNQFVCCHPDDCANILWSSGKTNRFGLGPYIIADGKFFILSDEGVLTITKATTNQYIPLGQAKILEGHDAWGPLAIVGGRLLARDSKTMVCVDIRAQN
jgi:outer membrane protein assembly factor BamB